MALNQTKNTTVDFNDWFALCIIAACSTPECPGDYVWDLKDCQQWRNRYDLGFTVRAAVVAEFTAH